MTDVNPSFLDIIIPVYNEDVDVVLGTVRSLQDQLRGREGIRIVVVNDGSRPEYNYTEVQNTDGVQLVEHDQNMGYGVALKSGILSGQAPYVAIIDADGTYPPDALPGMLAHIEHNDMVVGIRTGDIAEIPLARRFPKKVLNAFASLIAGTKIDDLNSGMRIFSRDLCYYLWGFFPRGFSFTSTLTMGSIMGGFRIKNVPINYYKRTGQSSIHPIKDTIRFFVLVCRLGLIFAPMRLFFPVAALIGLVGVLKGCIIDYYMMGSIGNITQTTLLGAVQIFMIGLIGQLVVWNRAFNFRSEGEYKQRHPAQIKTPDQD